MIINTADGSVGFFLASWQRRDRPPISWQERMRPGGRPFTNLRFIVNKPTSFQLSNEDTILLTIFQFLNSNFICSSFTCSILP